MARLYLLLFLAQIALAVVALISCLSVEEGEIRALPRMVWVLIILFFPLIGSIAWFVAGRPLPVERTGTARPTFPARERRQVAPDDDPDFLKSLNAEQSKQDREMFEKWEQDLRKREDDLKRREPGEKPES
jgi:hypothetical protein